MSNHLPPKIETATLDYDAYMESAARIFTTELPQLRERDLRKAVSVLKRLRHNDTLTLQMKDSASNIIKHVSVTLSDRKFTYGTHTTSAISEEATSPPKFAEVLLTLFARTKQQRAAIGDLNERYSENCERYGSKRANRLYWAEALQSLLPLAWRTACRVIRWAALVEAIKRYFSGG
ncbi:MAG TPA: permease prefix domain 2-containing transporter [Pseudolabrys sp.]|nr:permease prefix domain 2-containing transporter [Pseudolabrys sp.]